MSVDDLKTFGGNPRGFLGRIVGRLMNRLHTPVYRAGLAKAVVENDAHCLDIGCGGGKLVKLLASVCSQGKVHGLDHSAEMVRLARKTNAHNIEKGLVEISRGRVDELPFAAGSFDLITAFENIQFWPDLETTLKKVRRTLNSDGMLLIANRMPKEDSSWYELMQIKNADEYKELLSEAGFHSISSDSMIQKGWIFVEAR